MNTLREEWEEEFAKHLGEYENHHLLHGESFYEWAIKFINRINEAQRTADLEAIREGMPEPVKLTKEEENSIEGENRHYDYMVVRNDTEKKYRTKVLSLIEQIKNKKI